MEKKKIGIWFIVMTILAIIGFIAPYSSRSMFQSGVLSQGVATAIVALSMPIAMLATIIAISLLIYLLFKKEEKMEERKRSIGVTILGSLNRIFFGLISLVFAIIGLLMSFSEFGIKEAAKMGQTIVMFRLSMGYMILISAAIMITGNGVLKLQEKARTQTIYLAIIMLVLNMLFNLKNIAAPNFLMGLIYPVILVIFFTNSRVKEQFK